jgi:hypothetical protein
MTINKKRVKFLIEIHQFIKSTISNHAQFMGAGNK